MHGHRVVERVTHHRRRVAGNPDPQQEMFELSFGYLDEPTGVEITAWQSPITTAVVVAIRKYHQIILPN